MGAGYKLLTQQSQSNIWPSAYLLSYNSHLLSPKIDSLGLTSTIYCKLLSTNHIAAINGASSLSTQINIRDKLQESSVATPIHRTKK